MKLVERLRVAGYVAPILRNHDPTGSTEFREVDHPRLVKTIGPDGRVVRELAHTAVVQALAVRLAVEVELSESAKKLHCKAWLGHLGRECGKRLSKQNATGYCQRCTGRRLAQKMNDLPPEQRSERARRRQSAKTAEQRSHEARKSNARLTHEQRRERSQKGLGSTSQERSAAMRQRRASKTADQLSEAARRGAAAMTPAQRSERARRSNAVLTPEQRRDRARKILAAMTPEQSSERIRKGWETRRARGRK